MRKALPPGRLFAEGRYGALGTSANGQPQKAGTYRPAGRFSESSSRSAPKAGAGRSSEALFLRVDGGSHPLETPGAAPVRKRALFGSSPQPALGAGSESGGRTR